MSDVSDDSFISPMLTRKKFGEPISAGFTIAASKLSSDEPADEKLRSAASKISDETLRFYDNNDDGILEKKETELMIKNYSKQMSELLVKRAKVKKSNPLMNESEVKEFLE